ncbi:MAG: DUF4835 family protein [Balneolales bacterium]
MTLSHTYTKIRYSGSRLFLILATFFIIDAASAQSQAFEVDVEVNYRQISSSSGLEHLGELEGLIEDYLVNNTWTEDRFQEHERIRLKIVVNLNSAEGTKISATIMTALERPIYNTMQVTSLFVISDNSWEFDFRQNRSLIQDSYQYDDIASLLDFYAYMALGFDADSFSELGGQDYFNQARDVVETAQSAGGVGWASSGGTRKNRHYLVNNFLNPGYEDLRRAIYQYHRHGLDKFTTSTEEARDNALEAFQKIRDSQRQTSDSYPFDLLFSTKYREFTAFFRDATQDQRLQAYNLLLEMDRSHLTEYDKLQ